KVVALDEMADREATKLSGGQQQRLALARALVMEPPLLLLDEPLSNLDAKLRERMRWELKDLQRRTGITFVYVTHDQSEAMALSDRVAVMHQGELMQFGPPREVYLRPASKTVADFMGLVNLVPARVARVAGDRSLLAIGGNGTLSIPLPPGATEGDTVHLAIRPESLHLGAPAAPGEGVALVGRVADVTFLGNLTDCHVILDDGTRLRIQVDPRRVLEVGQPVQVQFDPDAASVFTL
ncbi:MAG TPA: ABC transporter ATP-binding protein, partial [Methylomirabilota bacterium]|nr:ABC transporter ATP-binding protein [Methylomirabilota bacterium]